MSKEALRIRCCQLKFIPNPQDVGLEIINSEQFNPFRLDFGSFGKFQFDDIGLLWPQTLIHFYKGLILIFDALIPPLTIEGINGFLVRLF